MTGTTARRRIQASGRSRADAALIGLAVLAVGLAAVAYGFEGTLAAWLLNVSWTAAALFAVIALTRGARRIPDRDRRRPWAVLALATGCWLAGQVVWDVYFLLQGTPGSPSFADAFWLAFAVIAVIGLSWFSAPGSTTGVRRYAALDIGALDALVAVAIVIVYYDAFNESTLPLLGRLVSMAYAVFYVAVVVSVSHALFRRLSVRRHPELIAVAIGTLLEAIAFVLWTPRLLAYDYVIGAGAIDLLWTLGMVSLGIAGLLAPRAKPIPAPSDADQRRRALLPTGAFVVSLALIPVFRLLGLPGSMRLTLQLGALVAGLCFAARLWMQSKAELRITEELRRSQADLDRFFELTPDMLCIADQAGRFVRVNPYFVKTLGHTAEELTSRPFFDFVHPDDVEQTLERMAGLNAGLDTVSFENRYRCHNGNYLTVLWNSTPDRSTGLIYAAARDITDLRRTEQELDRFFKLTPDMLAVLDLEGRLLRVNPFFASKLGYTPDELAGRRFADFVHPDDLERTLAESGRATEGSASATFENRYRRRDGSFITLLWSSAAVPEHGVLYAAARDVTELRRSTEEIRHLYDNAPCGFHSTAVDGLITHVNATELSWLGRNADELVGGPFTEVLSPASRAAYARSLVEVEQRGMAEVDCELVTRDGAELQVLLKIIAIVDDSDCFAGTYSTVIDMTERRRTEDALTDARDRALAASQMKSDFVANMSHEIRTPLNGVIGMTDLMLETPLAGEQRLYVEAIQASGNALMSVIGDILDFSKIESGKLELDHQTFALHELVESGCGLVAGQAGGKDIELMVSIGDNVPSGVIGDPTRLRQVIVNLVSNAVKFTHEGEILVRVAAQSSEESTVRVRFEVSDTGIGIPVNALDALFEPFVQADSSTTREYGGTGLGLAISKQLVESMGGEMGAVSIPSKGSTFWFTVPFIPAGGPLPARTQGILSGLRVLLADDNATNRTILEHHLARWSMECDTATGGLPALALAQAAASAGRPYDLALLDFNMPGLNGADLTRALRADPRLRAIRILILTSSGAHSETTTSGADGVLSKPVRRAELHDAIAGAMNGPRASFADEPAGPAGATSHHAGVRVLVAEDNQINQLVISSLLERRGFDVDIAADGQEAVDKNARNHYAAIFMDCQMPQLDGYEATGEIRRRQSAQRHVPIIAMTAHTMKGDREKCLRAGMDDYMGKPVRSEALDQVLERILPGRDPLPASTAVVVR